MKKLLIFFILLFVIVLFSWNRPALISASTYSIPTNLNIGTTPISGGGNNRILFENPAGTLTDNNLLCWDNTNKVLLSGSCASQGTDQGHLEVKLGSGVTRPGTIIMINPDPANNNIGTTITSYGGGQQQGFWSWFYTTNSTARARAEFAIRNTQSTIESVRNALTISTITDGAVDKPCLTVGASDDATSTACSEPLHVYTSINGSGIRLERTPASTGRYSMNIDTNGNFHLDEAAVATRLLINKTSGAISFGSSNIHLSPIAPTISSGFGTSPSISSNNGTVSFRINVGAGGTASSGVIGLPVAANGWNCLASDTTTTSSGVTTTKQTAFTTSTVTLTQFSDVSVQTAWAANDILIVNCFAF